MKEFIRFLTIFSVVAFILWFLRFIREPYTFCVDHPDKKLTDHYYLCEPFGIEIRKGIFEQKAYEQPVWEQKGYIMFEDPYQQQQAIKKKEIMINSKDVKSFWVCKDKTIFSKSEVELSFLKANCLYDKNKMKNEIIENNTYQEEL